MLVDPIFIRPGRLPKSPIRRARKLYELKAQIEAVKAHERRKYGTLGPASPVRRIDPKSYKID